MKHHQQHHDPKPVPGRYGLVTGEDDQELRRKLLRRLARLVKNVLRVRRGTVQSG